MPKRFRELPEAEKTPYSITEDARDGSLVYCANCDRAMEQGDCIVDDELDIKLQCAYSDCVFEGNIAVQSLYGWDAYRHEYEDETAHWPETPTPGECYSPEGDAP